jgi:phage shock protein E
MGKKIWIVAAVICGGLAVVKLLAKTDADEKAAAKEKIRNGALVIDVRTAGEFADGHFNGALNIPVQELGARANELGDTNRAIVVYCAAGVRAAKAKSILQKAGFKDVTNAGGLSDLKK